MYRRALLKHEGAEKYHKAEAVPRSAQGYLLQAPQLWAPSGTGGVQAKPGQTPQLP